VLFSRNLEVATLFDESLITSCCLIFG